MNVKAIDQTIRVLCADIQGNNRSLQDWRHRTEDELLYEACVCIFSSQMLFEVAEAAAQRLREQGLLQPSQPNHDATEYKRRLSEALLKPVPMEGNGKVQHIRSHVRNRLASLLTITYTKIYGQGQSLRKILTSCDSAKEARELLVKHVWGFGPKQASLFLRRVGYCIDLAILDTHILDYLRVARGIDPKPSALSRLAGYERVEEEFQRVASDFGYPVGCVDLAMWVTIRVAKREVVW